MSQVARQMEVREPHRKQKTIQEQAPAALPRKRITKGEKILWTLGVLTILAFAVFMVSNQAKIYLANHSINVLEQNIADIKDENKKLGVEKTQLSDPKRIMEYAKNHGFSLDIDNVKVIK